MGLVGQWVLLECCAVVHADVSREAGPGSRSKVSISPYAYAQLHHPALQISSPFVPAAKMQILRTAFGENHHA